MESARSALGNVEVVEDRIVDDAGNKLAFALEGQGYGKQRDTVEKVRSAVERIDNPPIDGVAAGDRSALLGDKSVGGTCFAQFGDQGLVGPAVGCADEVTRPLERHLQILDFAEIARKTPAGP